MKFLHPLAAMLLVLFTPAAGHSPVRVALADVTTAVPLPVTGNWFIGLLGALGCVYLVLGVWAQARKLFSRRPPIDEDIARLQHSFKSDLKEQTIFLTDRIDQVSEEAKDAVLDRERRWSDLQKQISDLTTKFARLEGALERQTHRR